MHLGPQCFIAFVCDLYKQNISLQQNYKNYTFLKFWLEKKLQFNYMKTTGLDLWLEKQKWNWVKK